ncbi:MAG: four helix bundle protein [Bacteroidetes bacterium GWA2_31_9b]|nr:MAG: four helix bundle protein [Bacteroidetes bacterium GWA2_31_9b]
MSSNFKSLIVWQKAHHFVLDVYKITLTFPKDELYGLTSQFRRAAISIPANIAEACLPARQGYTRYGDKDKLRFYNIAQGSLEECRYYLVLSNDLGYKLAPEIEEKLEEISKMLVSYMNKIKV